MRTSDSTIDRPEIAVELPAKHMEIRAVRANETYLFGSRGSFKTSRGIALFVLDMVYEMPRSTGVGVALSYEHLDKNTIDPLIKGFEDLGFKHGEHYVLNKRPPEDWPKPYLGTGSDKYDRTLTWHNGTTIKFISLARKAGANGVSAQWGFFDEVKFMNPDDLAEIFPIFRGNEQFFKHSSCYLSKFFATDKLADPAEIEWLLNKRKLVDHQRVEDIKAVQLHLDTLRARYYQEEMPEKQKASLKRDIFDLERILHRERRDLVYVAEINCYDVVAFLGEQWLKSARRNAKTEYIWKVAYENIDPDRPGDAFYPAWSEIHLYDTEGDEDIIPTLPFNVSFDYQHTVIPMPVEQISKLPGADKFTKNTVDYICTLYPQGLRDAVNLFCSKYKHHPCKRVNYVYDHTAIGKRTDADEYTVIVIKAFKDNGWSVAEIYTGQAPGHYQKYTDTDSWLKHDNEEELAVRVHKRRCEKLVKSISGAPAKTSNGKTEKDKRYENTAKYPDLDQSTTTHGSDAWDMLNDATLKQKLIKPVVSRIPMAIR